MVGDGACCLSEDDQEGQRDNRVKEIVRESGEGGAEPYPCFLNHWETKKKSAVLAPPR